MAKLVSHPYLKLNMISCNWILNIALRKTNKIKAMKDHFKTNYLLDFRNFIFYVKICQHFASFWFFFLQKIVTREKLSVTVHLARYKWLFFCGAHFPSIELLSHDTHFRVLEVVASQNNVLFCAPKERLHIFQRLRKSHMRLN